MSSVHSISVIDIYCSVVHSRHVCIVVTGNCAGGLHHLCESLSVSQTSIMKAVGPPSLLFIAPGLKRLEHGTSHSPALPPSLRVTEMSRAIVHFPITPIMFTETTRCRSALLLKSAVAGCVRRLIAHCIALWRDPNEGVHRAASYIAWTQQTTQQFVKS
jgi:hypothetical protein